METLKILIFNWGDIKNPKVGGSEVFTHETGRRWVQTGNEVTLLTAEFPGCQKEEILDGIKIYRKGGKYSSYWKTRNFYKKHLKGKYDLIIDEINTRPFFTPDFVREPIVALIHQLAREYWFYETPFPINYIGYYLLENRWLKKYIDIPTITVSKSTKQDLVDLGFKKVQIVSEGVTFKPCLEIPNKEDDPTIIYVGRLSRAKRLNHLLGAFQLIKMEIPNAKLWIVGDGYLLKKLERTASNSIKFFGYIPENDKITLMKKSWFLVNPSIREGFGLNIIEANACGTPCIAYDVPGLKDSILDYKTGVLVNPQNVNSLAVMIKKLILDNELRYKLSKNAIKYSTQFDWDKTAQDMFRIFKKIL
jgi:glycosyltransferase involved in cell wall biosynthesis